MLDISTKQYFFVTLGFCSKIYLQNVTSINDSMEFEEKGFYLGMNERASL